MLLNPCGRPEDVYCNGWNPKDLRHEALFTYALLSLLREYPEADVQRGPFVDQELLPDAELTLEGKRFNVEFFTESMRYAQIRGKWLKYKSVSDFLLVITTTETRMKSMIRHSERVADIALFATLEAVCKDPYGNIWIDAHGERASIR